MEVAALAALGRAETSSLVADAVFQAAIERFLLDAIQNHHVACADLFDTDMVRTAERMIGRSGSLRFSLLHAEGFQFYAGVRVPNMTPLISSSHVHVTRGCVDSKVAGHTHDIRVSVANGTDFRSRLEQSSAVAMLYGDPRCAHVSFGVCVAVFRHPVLSRFAGKVQLSSDLFCLIAWADPRVQPRHATTRPINKNEGLEFVHSLLSHCCWHVQEVPAFPLMCVSGALCSIESVTAITCG